MDFGIRLSFLLLLSILAGNVQADWSDDFESAEIGDPLFALGYSGEYANEATIQAVGVNGSKGFSVPAEHPYASWPGAWLYNQDTIINAGDSIEMSIDVQVQLAGELTSFRSNEQFFEFQMTNPFFGEVFLAQIGFDAASDFQQYRLYAYDTQNRDFVIGEAHPVSDLGLTGTPNEVSSFFKFHLSVTKTGFDRYCFEIQVRDLNGNTLASLEVEETQLGAVFTTEILHVRFGHLSMTTPLTLDNLRFDNYFFNVTQATEVPVGPRVLQVDRGAGAFVPDWELFEFSDNEDYSISRALTDLEGVTQFKAWCQSPFESPTSLDVVLEGSVFARSTVTQKIEIYDYVDQEWLELDDRHASRFSDSIVTVSYDGDISRVLSFPTNSVNLRITHSSVARRQRFSANVDRLVVVFGSE